MLLRWARVEVNWMNKSPVRPPTIPKGGQAPLDVNLSLCFSTQNFTLFQDKPVLLAHRCCHCHHLIHNSSEFVFALRWQIWDVDSLPLIHITSKTFGNKKAKSKRTLPPRLTVGHRHPLNCFPPTPTFPLFSHPHFSTFQLPHVSTFQLPHYSASQRFKISTFRLISSLNLIFTSFQMPFTFSNNCYLGNLAWGDLALNHNNLQKTKNVSRQNNHIICLLKSANIL